MIILRGRWWEERGAFIRMISICNGIDRKSQCTHERDMPYKTHERDMPYKTQEVET